MSFASLHPLTIGLVVAAYLLGSLSGRRLLARLRDADAHAQGSADAGGDPAPRAHGKRLALAVVAIDLGKGALAAWLALRFAPMAADLSVTAHGYLAALAAVAGHAWPIWHGFRGGKGAATLIGALLVLWPFVVPAVVMVWMAVIGLSGHAGLATVLAALSLPLLAWGTAAEPPRLWFAVAAALLIVWVHRGTLARLRAGSEARFARARLLLRWRRG